MSRAAALLALALALPPAGAAAEAPVLIRTTLGTPGPVWVGQRVAIDVQLSSPTTFASAPTFELPTVPGTVLMQVEARPVLGTETIDGATYVTQTHELALFAMRAGVFEIPSFAVRFAAPPAFGAPPVEHRLETSPLRIEARMPPGAEGIAGLVSTSELTVQDRWEPQPGRARVGDAFTRTVTRTAPDVPGLAFPPLRLAGSEGLAAYPAAPIVRDRTERGAFTGTRIDAVTYVCERPCTITLPAVELPWWNVASQRLETAPLPAVTIEVARGASTARSRSLVWWVGGMVLVLAAATAWWMRGHLRGAWRRHRARVEASEAGHFARVERACRAGDPVAAYNALLAWLDVRSGGAHSPTLRDDLLASHGDDELRRRVVALEDAVVDGKTRWDGAGLAVALRHVRHDWRARGAAATPPLGELNPR